MLPPDYQRILAVVRQTAGPVMARQVGEMLGVDISVRAKLEPLRAKLVRLGRPRLAAQTARRAVHHLPVNCSTTAWGSAARA
jgi:hypothetical protein